MAYNFEDYPVFDFIRSKVRPSRRLPCVLVCNEGYISALGDCTDWAFSRSIAQPTYTNQS